MQTGGVELNQEAARTVRIISVLVTPMFAVYAYLVVAKVLPSDHYVNEILTLTITALWIVASLWYYFRPAQHSSDQALRLGLIHFFAIMMFMFVIGFGQPFAVMYVMLLVASNLYFGRVGLALSTITLLIAASIDIAIRYPYIPMVFFDNLMTIFAVLFLGFSIIGIIALQETKRRTLLHSRQRERLQYDRILTIINNLSDAAFTTDDKGTIVMYNAACLDLLDTNNSLKGKNIGTLFKLTDKSHAKINLPDLLSDASRTVRRDDLSHTYTDGESIRLEITFAPIRSNFSLRKRRDELSGYIIIMRDVTNQKSLEEERDEFISVVSHELRTPITIVEGTLSNLGLLMSRDKKPDAKVLSETIETAHDQVLYLAKMVNDLSTLSRAERGVADAPESIDVSELLHTLHIRYEKEAQNKKLHLNLDLGPKLGSVNVSRLYLEELLQNFITNAIKYTKEGSVTIIAKHVKNSVQFTVKDTGIGISRSDQTKVFEKFYRSEDYRIRETNGTGLGLYVSMKLAHKLNTSIEVKSRINYGSSFTFELPAE